MNTTSLPSVAAFADHPVLIALDSLAAIKVSGADAQDFLQGQFSNDVALIDPRHCQLNAYCNPKGRALALVRLIRHGDVFWLILPTDMADAFLARLKMFVMRAKVVISVESVGLLGLIGTEDSGERDGEDIGRVGVGGIAPRQLLIGEKSAITSFVQTSELAYQPDDGLWRLLDILSGIPQVYPQTIEAFIPQMINLDWVEGISFTKGCYPGQEIIARLRHRGRVKQRLFIGVAHARVAPGDVIYTQEAERKKTGLVVDSVQTGDCEFTFSATAQVDALTGGKEGALSVGALSVGDGPATPIQPIPLPYDPFRIK